ncbi:MAG TPA: hypothetical protein VF178_13230 [Gemmatimonadaceae bacterium]
MAKRRVDRSPRRGRRQIAFGLLAFLAVTTLIVWRRSHGLAEARRLDALVSEQAALAAQRAELEAEVQRLSSRSVLTPVVERLGMRIPHAGQVILLPAVTPPER